MPLFALPCDARLERGDISFFRRESGDSLLPEMNIDAGVFPEFSGERGIPLPARDTQAEEGIIFPGLNLRRQHAGGGLPRGPVVAASLQQQNLAPGTSQFTGARGPYRPAPDNDKFCNGIQLGFLRNFLKRQGVYGAALSPLEENSMRSLIGFAILAVVGIFLLKFLFSILGWAVSIFVQLLVWAAMGFVLYLIIKVLSPSTAGKIREVVTGKPAM
jgi:hypothetical protein